jgi:hypothetical protein
MRPKFIITLGLLTILILGAALFLKRQLGSASAPPARAQIATPAPATASNAVTSVAPPPAPIPIVAAPVTNVLTDEQRQAAIDAETDRLQEWSMNDDPASLSHILADLTNPEREIRDAAIEATKQFGSSNAIPALKAAAANTADTEEQIALLEAANFLSLPSMEITPTTLEQAAKLRAEMEARRQAQRQQGASGQNPPAAPNN